MRFSGIEKTTLLDYPGKIAATVFTYGCNFRCPFCHNPELVVQPYNKDYIITPHYILDFLRLRKNKLDALVITGGEPCLHKDLPEFISKVKSLGYLVKLDTNGFNPEMVSDLIQSNIVDYWAMDIKNSESLYSKTSGVAVSIPDIKRSIKEILNSGVSYEFRTTVVPGLHDEKSIRGIGELVNHAKIFYIQNFRSGKTLDPKLSNIPTFTERDLHKFEKIIKRYVKTVKIRGV